ncbi:WD40 repeat [Macleaya cordata]|uniref:WD40 repeat n=1 Tax=Macleaya cordata TaxID=56857 RepID=A0A200Q7B7_MACCD|nr:WD40 repeat [Macleaya cordata]
MRSCSSEEDDRYFDTREEITSVSDSSSDYLDNFDNNSCSGLPDSVLGSFLYEVWIKKPASVNERRDRFFKWMGLTLDRTERENSEEISGDEDSVEIDRITESSGAVLGNSDFGDEFSSSRSSRDGFSSEDLVSEENFVCRIKNLDDGTEFIVDELGQDGMLKRLREVGSNRLVTVEEFQRNLGLSSLVQRLMRRGVAEASNPVETTKRVKKGWLKKLGAVSCIVNRQGEGGEMSPNGFLQTVKARVQRVSVRSRRKPSKEFSALYMGQEIHAHDGSILSMKFSPDGKYLASAGEDGIVRVWQVLEIERSIAGEISDNDPSCMYFTLNNSSELSPLLVDKEKMAKSKSLRKISDSAVVILPPKVFRLSEKPLHEFHGHSGEILDLSWSKNKCLLSCSMDNTVRLWKVGCNECVKIFSHNNYVTSVHFNPVDDNYFISGSIDGKVRIWAIPDCQVIDWTDVKEIVTAVCYRPNGQGIVVGSITGNCYIHDASDNHLQLGAQICLHVKKRSPGKRITGFQFFPSDPTKLMVTSADSQVRILDGVDVICKYRGLKNAGSQISATFTSDGKHIVSASEDSNIYIWNCNSQDGSTSSQAKSIWSCERFISNNASVAIPWCGINSESSVLSNAWALPSHQDSGCPLGNNSENGFQHCSLSSPDCFSLGHGFFSEAFPRGSATWPEEKLPTLSPMAMSSALCKSQYKFVKSSCESTLTSPHAWGLVIVTAGWDGCIRSFHNYGLPVRV